MATVKVIGAGSIGNHLAHGCRSQGWDVTIVDVSSEALKRTRDAIYPNRYGFWDENIALATPDELLGRAFDIVIVGTPPETHLMVATEELSNTPPKLLLIEKPLAHPEVEAIGAFVELARRCSSRVLVGYNQRYKPNTFKFLEVARDSKLGALVGLSAHMLESWDGILRAHFWMASEKDSYLAFTNRGGGALLEHSHALNLMLYFASELGQGRAVEVEANMDWVRHEAGEYDRDTKLRIKLDSGIVAEVRQDLHTWPARKEARAVFENGSVVWAMEEDSDSVTLLTPDRTQKDHWVFPKKRPDDFLGEISHLGDLLVDPSKSSSIELRDGLHVMEVALAAMESSRTGAKIPVISLGLGD